MLINSTPHEPKVPSVAPSQRPSTHPSDSPSMKPSMSPTRMPSQVRSMIVGSLCCLLSPCLIACLFCHPKVPSTAPSASPSTSHPPTPGAVVKHFCARSNQLTGGLLDESWCSKPDEDQCEPETTNCGGNKACESSVLCPASPSGNPQPGTPQPTSQPTSSPTPTQPSGGGGTPPECVDCTQYGVKDECQFCGNQGKNAYCGWTGGPSGSCSSSNTG